MFNAVFNPGKPVVLDLKKYIRQIDERVIQDDSTPLEDRIKRVRLTLSKEDVEKYKEGFRFRLRKQAGPKNFRWFLDQEENHLLGVKRWNKPGAKEEAVKVAYVKFCLENAIYHAF